MFGEIERVIKDDGAILLFGTGAFFCELISARPKLFRYDLVWDKVRPVGYLNVNRMPMRRHEMIAVFYKKLPFFRYGSREPKESNACTAVYLTANRGKRSTLRDRNAPVSLLRFPKPNVTSSEYANHPTQKPISLLAHLIKWYTRPGETVLDFTAGSGSTGVSAISCGRKFIGIEKEKQFYDTMRRRLESPIQRGLFNG